MSDTPIDPAVFAELRESTGADFIVELVETFLEEAPGMLAELRAARAAGDADAFRRAAHSLKSNAGTFGATELAARARDLELRGLDADPGRDRDAITALESLHAAAAQALKALCHG